jgi:hypothetical protein
LVFGGVVVDFGAASFCFHTILFFLGGVEVAFGSSSLFGICFFHSVVLICFGAAFFFCFGFFFDSFITLERLSMI